MDWHTSALQCNRGGSNGLERTSVHKKICIINDRSSNDDTSFILLSQTIILYLSQLQKLSYDFSPEFKLNIQ